VNRRIPAPSQRGFTLLEVMVAVIVFSIGLIGLGLLLTASIRANHVGFLHSQATFVAESIADRMRANIPGVWLNAYNGTWDSGAAAPGVACTLGAACSPAQVAARDVWAWGNMVSQLLPAGQGTVNCVPQPGRPIPTGSTLATSPAYRGSCTITLTWSEQSETADGAVPGSFTWVVTP
jgi:type IV pilus assembly protein PilV